MHLQRDCPLAPLTTWRIGGPAELYAEPTNLEELRECLAWARHRGLPVSLLGRGSNVLIADAGIGGLVIGLRKYEGGGVELADRELRVPAGWSLPKLSKAVAGLGFSGYEFYIGIPGTVGGAVFMNAGFGPGDERQTANRCTAVEVLPPDGPPQWRPYSDFSPAYRHSRFMSEPGWIILGACFALCQPASPEAIRAETAAHLALRKERQPLTCPTAGSVFAAAGNVPAAILIDRCGLKGTRIGDAIVSPKHANWIENLGHANAADVDALIRFVQQTVLAREGIALRAEIRRMGFADAD